MGYYNVVISFHGPIAETQFLTACLSQGARVKPCPGTDRFKVCGLSKESAELLREVAKYFRYW